MKRINFLYQDDNIAAIDKPAGILSVPDRYDQKIPNLKHLMRHLDEAYLIVHRLDKDTSGVFLLAKSTESQSRIQSLFEEHKVEKEYLAIVKGNPNDDSGMIDQPLVPHLQIKGKMVIHKKGKPAQTNWEVVERFHQHSLIKLHPKTGRTHQIRVHLQYLGYPIIADPLYGDGRGLFLSSIKPSMRKKDFEVERPLIGRTALHAHRISIPDQKNNPIAITSPLPKDFRAALNQLRKN